MAADNGSTSGILKYTYIREFGDSYERDSKEAAKYCKKLADSGNRSLMFRYAKMLEEGIGVKLEINLNALEYQFLIIFFQFSILFF